MYENEDGKNEWKSKGIAAAEVRCDTNKRLDMDSNLSVVLLGSLLQGYLQEAEHQR